MRSTAGRKGTVGVEARVPNAAGVGAESARRAETSVRAAAGRRSDHVAESSTLLEVMKGMDVIEVTKAPTANALEARAHLRKRRVQ